MAFTNGAASVGRLPKVFLGAATNGLEGCELEVLLVGVVVVATGFGVGDNI